MSLVSKSDLQELIGSFLIKDCTGKWRSDYHYGYGPLTIQTSWVTGVSAVIQPPSGPARNLDLGLQFVDGEVQVMPWDIGAEKIESGKWTATVTITGNYPNGTPFSIPSVAVGVFSKQVECCVDKLQAEVQNVPFNDVFRDEKSRLAAEMQTLLNRALDARDKCGNLQIASNIINSLKQNCRCGC